MPVLPFIDLLIFLGWTTLGLGGLLKAIYLTTSYRPTVFSLTPIDLFIVAMACLGLALTLAARTWVRLNEPQMLAGRRSSRRDALRASRPEPLSRPEPRPDLERVPAPDAPPPASSWQRVR